MRRGFTIIEVLVACAVLLVGLLVMVSSFSVEFNKSAHTRQRQLALVVAENTLTRLQAVSKSQAMPKLLTTPRNEEFFVVVDGKQVQARFETFVRPHPTLPDHYQIIVRWREPLSQGEWRDQELVVDALIWGSEI